MEDKICDLGQGEPVGEWVTYDDKGKKYKTTNRGKK